MTSSIDLCKELRRGRALKAAWRTVMAAGRASTSSETRAEIERFYADEDQNLERIARQLQQGRFKFAPAKGIAKKRAGKQPRPIVVAPVPNRIVQRAILDILQDIPSIRAEFLGVDTSFGGIKGRSVGEAVRAALQAISRGAKYYARSDIKDFFTKIRREDALRTLDPHIPDERFRELLRSATATELENLASLGPHAALFPAQIGVAQGCSLSSLVGNVLLREFDRDLNQRGIVCLRYVDDFLILGRNRENVRKAFKEAQRLLGRQGLDAYDPWTDLTKAERGFTDLGLEFLGCRIHENRAQPSQKSRARILNAVQDLLADSRRAMRTPEKAYRRRKTFVPTLQKLSNILEGWGKSYSFCDAPEFFDDMDEVVDSMVQTYFRSFRRSTRDKPTSRRLLRGIHVLGGASSDQQT